MSLKKKMLFILLAVTLLSVFSASFFLIRASVVDKQNFFFDLQMSNGLVLAKVLNNQEEASDKVSALTKLVPQQTGLSEMGVYLFEGEKKQMVTVKTLPKAEGAMNLEIPPKLIDGGVASSFHRDGLIVSVIPLSNNHWLILASDDAPIFALVTTYLKRVLPVLLVICVLFGILGWGFARKITEPLEALSLSTDLIAQGKRDIKLQPTSTLEINRLVSAFNELGVQLDEYEQKRLAKDRLATLGRFSAGMAHELKNPLNVISSYAQLIQRKSEKESKNHERALVIEEEVKRTTKIINDLLSFSRQKTLATKVIEIPSLLESLKRTYQAKEVKEDSLEFGIEEGVLVKADQDHLHQVLSNLLENALHAVKEVENPKVLIAFRKGKDEGAVIEVKDNGSGIAETDLPHLFEPFYTTKKVGEGTGLGLAYCKGVIEQHGGEISVKSSAEGTQFSISLPG